MPIVDQKGFLEAAERDNYKKILNLNDLKFSDFLVEITEDQSPMDMNDIDYIIILKIKITHIKNNISKIYFSQLNSPVWLAEFDKDLKNKYYQVN